MARKNVWSDVTVYITMSIERYQGKEHAVSDPAAYRAEPVSRMTSSFSGCVFPLRESSSKSDEV
jgi:hypothetical protein